MKKSQLEQMEDQAQALAPRIKAALPSWIGFCLVLFDVGHSGDVACISNSVRTDMINILRECADTLEAVDAHARARSS